MAPNPHTPLPLERLLTQLKREGFHISPDIYVGIQACLESHAQDWANYDRNALRADICLLVAKSEQERKRFFECFDVLYTQLPQSLSKEHVYTPPSIPSVSQEMRLPFLFGGIIFVLLLICVIIKLSSNLLSVPPVPSLSEASPLPRFFVPSCNKVGETVHFKNLSSPLQTNTSCMWDFGDGKQETTNYSPSHIYTQEGKYPVSLTLDDSTYTDTVQVYSPLQAKLEIHPQDVQLNLSTTFSFKLLESEGTDSLSVRWSLDTLISSSPQITYTFTEQKRYILTLILQRQEDCEPLILKKVFDFRVHSVTLAIYPFIKYYQEYLLRPWAIWVYVLLACFIVWFITYLVGKGFDTYNTYIPQKIKKELDEVLSNKNVPPYWGELPNLQELLQVDDLLYTMATKLRIPEESSRYEVDVFRSLDETIIGGGIPHIRYQALKKRSSYLVCIEQNYACNQQAKLFHYWFSTLAEVAEVDIVQYFFRDDPRELVCAESGKSTDLSTLIYLYPQHHLLFIGTGESLFTSRTEGEYTHVFLRDWVEKLFANWKQKSFFSPQPVQRWSHMETLLQDVFGLYSMSPKGFQAFASQIHPCDIPNYITGSSIGPFDWNTKAGLQVYFTSINKPTLLKWLGATVVYPLPDLNICLATGNLLGYETTYENLYALTSIPWMQSGGLSSNLRTELLGELTEKERKDIHQTIHTLLNKLRSSLPEDSRAWLVFSLQQYIIDSELDLGLKKYRQYLSQLCRLPESVAFHINQTPKRISLILTFSILFFICLLGRQYITYMEPSQHKYTNIFYIQDSTNSKAIYYTNLAIDSLDTNLDLAATYLDTALMFESDYGPALRYKVALGDKQAEIAYTRGKYARAVKHWQGQLRLQDSHHIHRLHSLGVCYFFLGRLDSAYFYRDSILSKDKDFFLDWNYVPHLSSLLSLDSTTILRNKDMVLVEGGEFMMGCTKGDLSCHGDETPHKVRVSTFLIHNKEVTFEEYDRFCKATGREQPDDEGWGRDRLPVINVNWYDAIAYCNWLSMEEGLKPCYTIEKSRILLCDFRKNGYRLPTEAEWEYAARGGVRNKEDIYIGTSDKESFHLYGNSCDRNCNNTWADNLVDDGHQYTSPVGSYQPNELGLYDMSGNVWEWCWDWYGDYPRKSIENPVGVKRGTLRVLRGGSWLNYGKHLKVSFRFRYDPNSANRNRGFRLARTLP